MINEINIFYNDNKLKKIIFNYNYLGVIRLFHYQKIFCAMFVTFFTCGYTFLYFQATMHEVIIIISNFNGNVMTRVFGIRFEIVTLYMYIYMYV